MKPFSVGTLQQPGGDDMVTFAEVGQEIQQRRDTPCLWEVGLLNSRLELRNMKSIVICAREVQ